MLSFSDTYDGVTAAGCFSPGHVPCVALHELIRIVKPGMKKCTNLSYWVTHGEHKYWL